MFKINIESVQALAERAYLPHAEAAFGNLGAERIRILLNNVKLIFQHCPPERLPGTLTVVSAINATPISPLIDALGSSRSCHDYSEIGRFLIGAGPHQNPLVELATDGSFRLLLLEDEIDLKHLAKEALVYRHDGNAERILAREYEDFIPTVSPILKSNFSVPTFHNLEEAFRYYSGYVLESKCRLLKDVWEGGVDGPRLVLVNKPEAKMRDSLTQILEIVLRDATVKPEQNTDETKPVDIRVSWFASGATALIEIKWLGKATAKSKSESDEPTYTEYSASRAQSGANQLADYMDREVRHSDATAPQGYLVVFDARRKGTKGAGDHLSKVDAMAFSNDTLNLDPDHSTRDDFAAPVRFFMNPRQSFFLAA